MFCKSFLGQDTVSNRMKKNDATSYRVFPTETNQRIVFLQKRYEFMVQGSLR